MGKKQRPTARHPTERKRDFGTHSSKLDISHQIPPLRAQGIVWKRKQDECGSQRGWGTPGEQGALSQPSKAQINSVTEAASTGLAHVCTRFSAPGSLRTRHNFQSSVFMGLLRMKEWVSDSVPSLVLFTHVGLSNLDVIIFVFNYFVVLQNGKKKEKPLS